jgi:hypothetical protein
MSLLEQTLEIGAHPVTWKKVVATEKKYNFAIVRHIPRDVLSSEGKPFAPDTVPMQDRPAGSGKGDPIRILPSWWSFIRKINNDKGYKYVNSIFAMWINNPFNQEDPNAKVNAESIIGGGNPVAYDMETTTHIRLVSWSFDKDTSTLNPLLDNWYWKPYLFWYPVAIDIHGNLIHVSGGVDAYFPLIKHTELWMNKNSVELFPDGYDYVLRGMNVYNGSTSNPLMTVDKMGKRTFYDGWKIDTYGVLPPETWA